MNSAIGAIIGLVLAIVLIIRKFSPVYSLLLGAVVGGLMGGMGLDATVANMISGVKDITPAIIRIIAAGVLSGVLIKTGAAASISHAIVNRLGRRHVYLALALATMLLTAVGVFVDVAVITVAPIAIIIAQRVGISRFAMLLAMVGGGKCGNIISPNPNTIIAAENFSAPLSSVMLANIAAAVIGLIVTVYIILPLMPSRKELLTHTEDELSVAEDGSLPSFWASIAGPVVVIVLLMLRPLAGIAIDPLIALPVGGVVTLFTTRKWSSAGESISYGLEIPYVPVHGFSSAAFASWKGLKGELCWNFKGDRKDSNGSLPDWNTLDISISKDFKSSNDRSTITIRISGRNLLNYRYELSRGYPMPGRSFMSAVMIQF